MNKLHNLAPLGISKVAVALFSIGLNCSAATAFAASDFEASSGAHQLSANQRFGINPNSGRAWVEFNAADDFTEPDQTQRVTIPGLSYDRDAEQVILTAGGQKTVCASVHNVGGQSSNPPRIEQTGACELTLSTVDLPVSTGIGFYKMEHFEVQIRLARNASGGPGQFAE